MPTGDRPGPIIAVLFDFGDTLADEASERKDERGVTLSADLLPGAAEGVRRLHSRGIRLALVADGLADTYENVLRQHRLASCFEARAVSEIVGAEKPDPRPFTWALDALAIAPPDHRRVAMVGNRLDRDVAGANRLGLVSIWVRWSTRYRSTPVGPLEQPDITVRTPLEAAEAVLRRNAAALRA